MGLIRRRSTTTITARSDSTLAAITPGQQEPRLTTGVEPESDFVNRTR